MSWVERRAAEIVAHWEREPSMPFPKHIEDRIHVLADVTPAEAAGWYMHMDDLTPGSRHAWAGWLAREIARGVP